MTISIEYLAGGLGFEPRQAESESAVLPLDDPPKPGSQRAQGRAGVGPYNSSPPTAQDEPAAAQRPWPGKPPSRSQASREPDTRHARKKAREFPTTWTPVRCKGDHREPRACDPCPHAQNALRSPEVHQDWPNLQSAAGKGETGLPTSGTAKQRSRIVNDSTKSGSDCRTSSEPPAWPEVKPPRPPAKAPAPAAARGETRSAWCRSDTSGRPR